MSDDKTPGNPDQGSSAPGAKAALILLVLINLFNYIDRQVLAAVVPQINVEPVGGPTREAALDAAKAKIEAAKPKPVVTEAEKTAAWEV